LPRFTLLVRLFLFLALQAAIASKIFILSMKLINLPGKSASCYIDLLPGYKTANYFHIVICYGLILLYDDTNEA